MKKQNNFNQIISDPRPISFLQRGEDFLIMSINH
jgi:hypothetical protein